MTIQNYAPILDAAKQLETAARALRQLYVRDMSEELQTKLLSTIMANIHAAVARIEGSKTSNGY